MLEISIPGYGTLRLTDLILDYNGTLARDGQLIIGVKKRLRTLSKQLRIHILTADTFGKVAEGVSGLPCELSILPAGDEAQAKLDYIKMIGTECVVAIGNGRNDRLMLEGASLGIALIQQEGAAVETLTSADAVSLNILEALDCLSHPLRLVATLRS